jgi:hypothetical protein
MAQRKEESKEDGEVYLPLPSELATSTRQKLYDISDVRVRPRRGREARRGVGGGGGGGGGLCCLGEGMGGMLVPCIHQRVRGVSCTHM